MCLFFFCFVGPVTDSILHCNTSSALPVFYVSGVNDSSIRFYPLLFIEMCRARIANGSEKQLKCITLHSECTFYFSSNSTCTWIQLHAQFNCMHNTYMCNRVPLFVWYFKKRTFVRQNFLKWKLVMCCIRNRANHLIIFAILLNKF